MKPVLFCPQCLRNLPDDCVNCWECGMEGVKRRASTPSNPGPIDVPTDPSPRTRQIGPAAALLPFVVLLSVLLYHGPRQAGRLVIRTEPPGAVVTVEGRTLGVTPLHVEGNAGSYWVTIRLEDHEAVDAQVVIPKGGSAVAEVSLTPSPRRKPRKNPGDSSSLRIADNQTTARVQVAAAAVREL